MAGGYLLRAAPLLAAAAYAQPTSTPNVLFIAVDDLRPEHGVYGGQAVTPNIDNFAKGATTFLRNYVQVGVCSPSRTSLLTGRYPDWTHVTDLYQYFRSVGCNVTTLPQAFKDAGYVTAGANKIFHPGHASGGGLYPGGGCPGCDGYNDPPSWNEYFIAPSLQLYPWNTTYANSWYALPESQYPESMHPDSQAATYISGMIQNATASGKPFFLAPGFLKPHLPFIFPEKYLSLYADYNDTAADADPADPAEAPLSWTGWSEFRSYADITALINSLHIDLSAPVNAMPRAKQVEMRKAYFSAVSYNDAQVGAVLSALEASGAASSTVVVIWGDHGWMLNDGGDWAKHTNFESVVRAPLLIRSPAHPASWGARVMAFTEHVDIFPTLLALTGVAMPGADALQGESLVPLLEDPTLPALPTRAFAYSQYPRHTTACPGTECSWPHAMGYTIRTPDWRYTEWVDYDNTTYVPNFDPKTSKTYQVELWDHRGDVGSNWTLYERANLATNPAYAAVVKNMSALLHAGPNLHNPTLPPAA